MSDNIKDKDDEDKTYLCPVCGYDGLDIPAYFGEVKFPVDRNLEFPYYLHFGNPSYSDCDCCGYYFGHDDDDDGGNSKYEAFTFHEYLCKWILQGAIWHEFGMPEEFDRRGRPNPDYINYVSKKPEGWSLVEQLKNIGIDFDSLGLPNPQFRLPPAKEEDPEGT